MSYTPPKVSATGDKGHAKVLVNTNDSNKILVRLRAQTWNKENNDWTYENKEFKLLRSDCPDEIQKLLHSTSNAYVQMSGNGDKIYKFYPWEGMFAGKFAGFTSEKDKPPVPRTSTTKWEYVYMVAKNEIVDGEFKGAIVPYTLRYHFVEVNENGKLIVGYSHPKSQFTPQLMEYLDVTGAWEKGPMLYQDNILVPLQKRMLAENRTFKFVIKEGQINTIFASDTPNVELVE